ncbi:hypothetical protein M9H77_13744 [Catharanthus roseus]|uniref:Uncharacterized protein n=1 Tax=Catharanthus roseus TaxID=4058 RepID=A0ACC0BL76_CATRO|nr:hypothetical protein M9H77_13744 [Catharanthus roseus]
MVQVVGIEFTATMILEKPSLDSVYEVLLEKFENKAKEDTEMVDYMDEGTAVVDYMDLDKALNLSSIVPPTYSPKALETLYNCEKYDALRYKQELTSLLKKDVKEKGLEAMKTAVMENDPPLIRSSKILTELEGKLKKEETEFLKGKELVFISSSSSKDRDSTASINSSSI